mmetsp:Transcript_62519/g.136687  ORF Transcript_62519/g.136687 Transcript_62519/m.136687 type:complete len:989 (-) Transcript_62519:56-3022(-)|eukprot:CAMPEP_0206421122 /NCGR_PEP_ID=MMETSP0324_2-20121206/1264_1 /ASSEMBLY_ACC=CAM_ASM_000836 /TAXON_ID=2866 /ORGANISM="Crypthecodinium cohnii, Strain Seligo" /LENGTH=988 /DNA_ID=CAMNT_0053885165 /DNA_START=54 /DNA_END=3020 /DNA_ORIENTATION=+
MVKKTKKGKERLDKFYQLAKDQGYRSRASFKLVQLAKKHDFLSKSQVCIDLCAAPGGWAQVAQKQMPRGSTILAIDLVPIRAIHGVTCIQSDITTEKCRSLIKKELAGKQADVVLHDGAPNVGANWVKDAFNQNELVLHSTKLACEHLRVGGYFVTKVFRSQDYNSLLWVFNQLFNKVEATKPTASRNVSAEIFVMCMGFKGGKIDPKFFDPRWVFMEMLDPIATAAHSEKAPTKTSGTIIAEYLKHANGKHRGGYEEGDDMRIGTAAQFLASENPAEMLVTHHRLSLTADKESEAIDQHESTSDEIRELVADLKVLGRKDLTTLLKWRIRMIREKEKADRAARKSEKKPKEDKKSVEAASLDKNIDAAIDELLDEDAAEASKSKKKKSGDDEEGDTDAELAQDEKMEEELAEQIERRRKEERRDLKKMVERQKKADLRKKMSLGASTNSQDQPELFSTSKKNIKALEDQDKYVDPSAYDSPAEESEGMPEIHTFESDDEDGLDRIARMEVDMAVRLQLSKMGDMDKNRKKQARQFKKKKETRRQRVMAAWAGEMSAFNESITQQAAADHELKDKDSDSEEDDDDDNEAAFVRMRNLQDGKESTADSVALNALLSGPPKGQLADRGEADDVEEDDDEDEKVGEGATSSSRAMVAVGDDEGSLKDEHRMARWFSQDIFAKAPGSQIAKRKPDKIIPLDRDSEDDSGEDNDDSNMIELPDSKLPKLPLTDKEKRKIKRKEDLERSNKRKKGKNEEEEDNRPMEVAPLEPPRPIVPMKKGPQRPDDPKELAETLAMGHLLTESKKTRMDLIDAGYNRWTFEGDELLPDWFREEEERFNKPELPVSKELMAQYRAKLKEINARPIRKVTQAKARKQRRLGKRLQKLRSTAMSLLEAEDMSAHSKAKQMKAEVRKLAKQDQRKITIVNIKKGGGGKTKGGMIPKGAKVKVMDRRMKADIRGQKKAAARNKSKNKALVKKQMKKKQSKAQSRGK